MSAVFSSFFYTILPQLVNLSMMLFNTRKKSLFLHNSIQKLKLVKGRLPTYSPSITKFVDVISISTFLFFLFLYIFIWHVQVDKQKCLQAHVNHFQSAVVLETKICRSLWFMQFYFCKVNLRGKVDGLLLTLCIVRGFLWCSFFHNVLLK